MAHKLHVPLDVDWPTEDKILAAGPMASYLFLASMAFAKRTLSDGKIASAQLYAIAPGLTDVDVHADKLVAVGLWAKTGYGWRIPSWLKHNVSKRKVEAASEIASQAGILGNHQRHHVEAGKVSPKCPLCVDAHLAGKTSGTRSGRRGTPESGAIAKPERSQSQSEATGKPEPEPIESSSEQNSTTPDDPPVDDEDEVIAKAIDLYARVMAARNADDNPAQYIITTVAEKRISRAIDLRREIRAHPSMGAAELAIAVLGITSNDIARYGAA